MNGPAINSIFWAQPEETIIVEKYNNVYKNTVPLEGPADTIGGEIIRAASRLLYDIFNNGYGQNNYSGAGRYIGSVFTGEISEQNEIVNKVVVNGRIISEHTETQNLEVHPQQIVNALDEILEIMSIAYFDVYHPLHVIFSIKNTDDYRNHTIPDYEFYQDDDDYDDDDWD